MPPTAEITRLERELDDEIATRRNRRQRVARLDRIIERRDDRADVIADEVDELRAEREHGRERAVELRELYAFIEKRTPQREPRLLAIDAKIEALVDQHEALTAQIQRLLVQIDRVDDASERAQQLRRERNAELRAAIDRIDRIKRQLDTAIEENRGRLSAHFVLAEFACHNGAQVPADAVPALRAFCVAYLEPLRAWAGGPIGINSAYRPEPYNTNVGGARLSLHVYNGAHNPQPKATAVDHVAAGKSPSQVQGFARGKVDGLGVYSVFTHGDNRNRIGWGDAVWNGP